MRLLIDNYEDELTRLAKDAIEIKVIIAFLTEGGLNWLPKGNFQNVEFIVGIDLGITTPEALKTLQGEGADVRIFAEPGKLFHPKAIYFKSSEDETLIVGSNNLTSGGIASNHEVSISIQKDDGNGEIFEDFLAHYESLKAHECCGIPDEDFYNTYSPTRLRAQLKNKLNVQKPALLNRSRVSSSTIKDAEIATLGDYIRLLAKEFPTLDRRNGIKIKNHPLKVLNDTKFLPLFKNIVSTASKGRLKGSSQLNVGGKWYLIPNIFAYNDDREPWGTLTREVF